MDNVGDFMIKYNIRSLPCCFLFYHHQPKSANKMAEEKGQEKNQLLPDSPGHSHERPKASSSLSLRKRAGPLAIIILIGSTVLFVVCVFFLWFLWYGTPSNRLWHLIIMRSWAARAVTITSIVLRGALTLQGGVCLSMLAAIALERSSVPLDCVGKVSLMRADGDKGLVAVLTGFAWPLLRSGPRFEQLVLPAVLLVLMTTFLGQFTSTALLSDFAIRPVPGYNETVTVAYDFAYRSARQRYNCSLQSYVPVWSSTIPPQLPMFVEHSEPPIRQDNVTDTGPSLRAFLPLAAQERARISSYSGKAVVLDSRVTCQQPVVEKLGYAAEGIYELNGTVRPSTSTPRLDMPQVRPFQCEWSWGSWSFCQLSANALWLADRNFSGGLVSEFREFPLAPGQNKSGAAFLLFFTEDVNPYTPLPHTFGPEFVTVTTFPILPDPIFHMTICYASLDVANRWIDAYSGANRTEPAVTWSDDAGAYDTTAVTSQLYSDGPPEERGIMRMQPPENWSAPQSGQPFNDGPGDVKLGDVHSSITIPVMGALHCLTSRLHVTTPRHTYGANSNYYLEGIGGLTAIIAHNGFGFISEYGVFIDPWLSAVFTNLYNTSHSPAVALQGVITSLAGIQYYNWLGQFNKSDTVSMVSFVDLLTPGGALGQPRVDIPSGLVAVIALLAFHLLLVAAVAVRFWKSTHISRIGDNWQAIAQVALSEVQNLKQGLKDAMALGAGRNTVREVDETSGKILRVDLAEEDGVKLKVE